MGQISWLDSGGKLELVVFGGAQIQMMFPKLVEAAAALDAAKR